MANQKWDDIRKYGLILVIAILYAIFANTAIDAFITYPQYEEYCKLNSGRYYYPYEPVPQGCDRLNISTDIQDACTEQGGQIFYRYDELGCPTSYECSTCQKDFDAALQKYNLQVFMISAVLGIISIIAGMLLPYKKNMINEWIGSGLIFGGLFTLFTGTFRSFGQLGKAYKPMIILAELILVIFIAYKLYGRETKHKR